MKEAAYNFIVLSKTYLNSQVISKRKSTKSQHIEQNERATGRPGRATTVLRAEGAAHGPVWQQAGPPVARKHRTGPCHGPGQKAGPRTGPNLTGQMYIYMRARPDRAGLACWPLTQPHLHFFTGQECNARPDQHSKVDLHES